MSKEFYAKAAEANAFVQQPETLTYKGTGSESGGVAGMLEVTDAEFGASEDRQLEMKACSKALAGLSSDVAQDLFTKTFNLALVQTECKAHSERRSKASALLSGIAEKLNSPRRSAIAKKVRLGAFTQVLRSTTRLHSFCRRRPLRSSTKTSPSRSSIPTISRLKISGPTLKTAVGEMQVQM